MGEGKNRRVLFVVGSNRTGTSLFTTLVIARGFSVPGNADVVSEEYSVHENSDFKNISRNWNTARAKKFVDTLENGQYVLKYPKASYVIDRWLELVPDARVAYVFRPMDEAVASQIKHWWGDRPFKWLAKIIYRYQWIRGMLALRKLRVPVMFISFEELKSAGTFEFPQSWGW